MSGAYYMSREELVEGLGEICTDAFLGAFGGQRLYVPRCPGPEHPITEALGPRNAAKVASFVAIGFAGLDVELPLGRDGSFATLRRRVQELAADPLLTEKEIARQLRVHIRTVRRARAKVAAKPE